MPERLPSRPLGIHTFVLRSAIFEDEDDDEYEGDLRNEASPGSWIQAPGSCSVPPADQRNLLPRDLDAVAGF
jgi:hypothetical protein